MRGLLIFMPALLLAQTPAAPPKPAAAKKTATAKPGAAKPKAAAAKPKPAAAAPATAPALTTDDEKLVYSLGLSMYQALSRFDLSPAEVQLVRRALLDASAGKPALQLSEWGPKIQEFALARSVRASGKEKAASQAYLDKAAAEPGAIKTESGMIYRELRPGTGESPKPTDSVKVNYRGTLVNGTEFDSSYKRNEPAQLALNGVIPCWTEGLQKMKPGAKATLACPSNLAYGDQGRPPIPGGAALIFEIELIDIVKAEK